MFVVSGSDCSSYVENRGKHYLWVPPPVAYHDLKATCAGHGGLPAMFKTQEDASAILEIRGRILLYY